MTSLLWCCLYLSLMLNDWKASKSPFISQCFSLFTFHFKFLLVLNVHVWQFDTQITIKSEHKHLLLKVVLNIQSDLYVILVIYLWFKYQKKQSEGDCKSMRKVRKYWLSCQLRRDWNFLIQLIKVIKSFILVTTQYLSHLGRNNAHSPLHKEMNIYWTSHQSHENYINFLTWTKNTRIYFWNYFYFNILLWEWI